jgi:hypothetical protein
VYVACGSPASTAAATGAAKLLEEQKKIHFLASAARVCVIGATRMASEGVLPGKVATESYVGEGWWAARERRER